MGALRMHYGGQQQVLVTVQLLLGHLGKKICKSLSLTSIAVMIRHIKAVQSSFDSAMTINRRD